MKGKKFQEIKEAKEFLQQTVRSEMPASRVVTGFPEAGRAVLLKQVAEGREIERMLPVHSGSVSPKEFVV